MCPDSVRWLYRIDQNVAWQCSRRFKQDYVFFDADGTVRLIVQRDGTLTVTRGYAWNGCSPKICIFDIVLGPPEGVVHAVTGHPKTYYASLLHDALYQFLHDGLPLTRAEADHFFLDAAARNEFPAGADLLGGRACVWPLHSCRQAALPALARQAGGGR